MKMAQITAKWIASRDWFLADSCLYTGVMTYSYLLIKIQRDEV